MRIPLHTVVLFVAAVVLASFFSWMTYLQPGSHLVPGLDAAYTYGFNYAFLNKLIMGRDIIFTFGPLGFFEHTRLLANSMLYMSSGFWFLVSITVNVCLLIFSWQSSNRWMLRLLNMMAGIMLVMVTYPHIQRLLLIPTICLFLYWRSEAVGYLVLFSVATVLCLLIKFSYGVAALSLLLPFLLLLAWRDKSLRAPLIAGVALLVTYSGLWFIIYGELTGSLGYIRGGLQFSQGSTTAMATNPDNNWWEIGGLYTAIMISLAFICREYRRGMAMAPLAFLGPLYIWSKYAFGVEDAAHLAFLISWVFYAIVVWFIAAQHATYKCVHITMLACAFFAWTNMHTAEIGVPDYSLAPHFGLSNQAEFGNPRDIKESLKAWRDVEPDRIKSLLLPSNMRNIIGSAAVDIYPWEASIAAANHLHWAPRPVFQNYISYTPYLDAANQHYLSGADAPEYIVWHHHSFQDIGTRYPFNSDPLTLDSIFRHYKLTECAGQFCLWKKMPNEQIVTAQSNDNLIVHWDEWVTLPEMSADIIKAHISASRNLLGMLNLLVWKEGGIDIDYRLWDGSIKTHSLPIDNAVSGVWVSPYLQDVTAQVLFDELTQDQIKQLLAVSPGKGYFDKVEATPAGLHVAGWSLLPFESTNTQKLSVLLYNEKHAYRVSVGSRLRPDITDFFQMRGVVDLDSAGFDQNIVTNGIVPADYHLRVLIENNGTTAIAPDQNIHFKVSPSANKGNVEAIRIRTTRPWAFADTLSLNWEVVQFTGKAPW